MTTDAREQQQQLVQAIFLAANNRVFAPVFWFCLLGPAGVVLYRLLTLAQKDNAPYAANLLAIADWLPIRILTFIFALGGHFVLVFSCWKHKVFQNRSFNTELLMECGQAALSLPENKKHEEIPAKETIGLLDRSFIIFLVIIAFFVLVTGK